MFSSKPNDDMQKEKTNGLNGTTLISSGTIVKGDISSNSDLRIDGTVTGNIQSSSKIIIGASGVVNGDISGNQADIFGKVSGNIKTKDLLQLRGDCIVNGNLFAGKLQVEPAALFNGQCHMGAGIDEGANIVDIMKNEPQSSIK